MAWNLVVSTLFVLLGTMACITTLTRQWKRRFGGITPQQYLKLATKFLRQSEEMTSRSMSIPLQFMHEPYEYLVKRLGQALFLRLETRFSRQFQSNQVQRNRGQCVYLVEKLEMAIRSAKKFMSLSSSEQISASEEKCKFLFWLAMNVKQFVQECCKTEWIQAASILINAFEHVTSLSTDLELCIWSFENGNRTILGTALMSELITISEAQERRLRDQENFLKEIQPALNLKSLSDLRARQLATSLLGKLEACLANIPIPDKPDLVGLSIYDQVNLLREVEATLSSECISNLDKDLAGCLVERFRAAVDNPIPNEPHLVFMRNYEGLIERGEKIGHGTFGDVYKVQWLGTPAAEKMLDLLEDEEEEEENEEEMQDKEKNEKEGEENMEKEMEKGMDDMKEEEVEEDKNFDEEVKILARQSHPNIVRLLCYVKDSEGLKCSLIQELMDDDLSKLIEKRMKLCESTPFSTYEVVDVMLQIAQGMDYLHRRRVLHRDLKPENVLVKREKIGVHAEFVSAKVADFGLSKMREKSITVNNPTPNMGTTRWMAPELIEATGFTRNNNVDGTNKYPFRSDVFSFGMVCFNILTGHVPFENTPNSKVRIILKEGGRPDLPRHCPPSLACMIKRCWRTEQEERPSFAEICTELRFMKGSLLIGRDL